MLGNIAENMNLFRSIIGLPVAFIGWLIFGLISPKFHVHSDIGVIAKLIIQLIIFYTLLILVIPRSRRTVLVVLTLTGAIASLVGCVFIVWVMAESSVRGLENSMIIGEITGTILGAAGTLYYAAKYTTDEIP